MKKKDVIEYFGGIKQAAIALNIWPQTIYQWSDDVPENVAYKIQVITDGALKVEDKDNGNN